MVDQRVGLVERLADGVGEGDALEAVGLDEPAGSGVLARAGEAGQRDERVRVRGGGGVQHGGLSGVGAEEPGGLALGQVEGAVSKRGGELDGHEHAVGVVAGIGRRLDLEATHPAVDRSA